VQELSVEPANVDKKASTKKRSFSLYSYASDPKPVDQTVQTLKPRKAANEDEAMLPEG
jgi:hypothetical protein